MNKEIKEILDEMLWQFEKYPNDDFIIKNKESRILLDYITNLQQENERLKEIIYNLEEYIQKGINKSKMFPTAEMAYQLILDKLKELEEKR